MIDRFLKLGGSLITDKTRAYTAQHETIARLAHEVAQALEAAPDMSLLIGHGSGSFGHWAAEPYDTREGVRTSAQWRGYAEVAAAAARLNRIVADAFLERGVPILSLQPSASARCHDGQLSYLDTYPIHQALSQGLVPLVYGDVALDEARGGTIASTEDIFFYLAEELHPTRVVLLSKVEGVLDTKGNVIRSITPENYPSWRETLSGSAGVDVTGGMADKVARMVELVKCQPELSVHILTGTRSGLLTRALLTEENDEVPGTRITAR